MLAWAPLWLTLALTATDSSPAHPGLLGTYPATRESSGTSWQPEDAPMEGVHGHWGGWRLMVHGFAFGVYGGHTGLRRDHEAYSTNMVMAMASRPAGGGALGLRAMLSLEPLLGPRGYPLLLQTGETADGREHLFDRQHPHDLAMELAATWSRPLGARRSVFAYLGLPGEPALGPPAFMHRPSAVEIPTAPLAHHWLDSTHITYGVVTLGLTAARLKLDASAFRGRESDQHRWNLERPRLDSFALRATFNPSPRWSLQASGARIAEPEALHPGVDVQRLTLSLARSAPLGPARLESLLAVGRNRRSRLLSTSPFTTYPPTRNQGAVLLESALRWPAGHALLARIEWVEKDELFVRRDAFHVRTFPVAKLDVGAVREVAARGRLSGGAGFTLGIHRLPEILHGEYGRWPWSYSVFARVRIR